MPNMKGGKKFKKGKKNNISYERNLVLRNPKDHQEYAKILKINGSGRYQVFCFDGIERLGICAGTIKRKFRFNLDDIILICKWEFQDTKCSIIHKYDEDEVLRLKNENEFPPNITLENENEYEQETDYFDYDLPSDNENEDDINLDDI